jgi:hypothetical protein
LKQKKQKKNKKNKQKKPPILKGLDEGTTVQAFPFKRKLYFSIIIAKISE